jgi:hypothetical protein
MVPLFLARQLITRDRGQPGQLIEVGEIGCEQGYQSFFGPQRLILLLGQAIIKANTARFGLEVLCLCAVLQVEGELLVAGLCQFLFFHYYIYWKLILYRSWVNAAASALDSYRHSRRIKSTSRHLCNTKKGK